MIFSLSLFKEGLLVQICKSETFDYRPLIEGHLSAWIPFNAQVLVVSFWDIEYVLWHCFKNVFAQNISE